MCGRHWGTLRYARIRHPHGGHALTGIMRSIATLLWQCEDETDAIDRAENCRMWVGNAGNAGWSRG